LLSSTESKYPAADDVSTINQFLPSSSSIDQTSCFLPFNSSSTTFDFQLFSADNNNENLDKFTSNPLFDQNSSSIISGSDTFSFDAPVIDDSILNEAWQSWSNSILPGDSSVEPLEPKQEETEAEFDLFEFLRKEAEGVEVVC